MQYPNPSICPIKKKKKKSKYMNYVRISLSSQCCPYMRVWIKNIITCPIKINSMPILELVCTWRLLSLASFTQNGNVFRFGAMTGMRVWSTG